MLYMKTLVLIISMCVLLLTATLRGIFGEVHGAGHRPEAWITVAFVLAVCLHAVVLAWSGL